MRQVLNAGCCKDHTRFPKSELTVGGIVKASAKAWLNFCRHPSKIYVSKGEKAVRMDSLKI